MCGRFGLWAEPGKIASHFQVQLSLPLTPRYNIAPSQEVPAVRETESGGRELAVLRWGLIPHWAKEERIGYKMINARSDAVFSKPAYRAAIRRRRCLIPASGFFEWQRSVRGKQPYLIKVRDADLFAMAGLWERWTNPETGEVVESCTIMTTRPNSVVGALHDRMPVIIEPDFYALWLDPAIQDPERISPLLQPTPEEQTVVYRVSREVNNPANDRPSVLRSPEDKRS